MPKLTDQNRKEKVKKLTKDYAAMGFNQTALAKKYGVTRSTVGKKLNDPKNKCIIQELLNDDLFKRSIISIGLKGMSATKPIAATILVDKDGEVVKAEEQGAIEVPDYHAIHKYWRDFLKAMGFLVGDGVNIQFGDRNTQVNVNQRIIKIIRSPNHKPLKKVVTVNAKPKGV